MMLCAAMMLYAISSLSPGHVATTDDVMMLRTPRRATTQRNESYLHYCMICSSIIRSSSTIFMISCILRTVVRTVHVQCPTKKNFTPWLFFSNAEVKLIALISSVLIRNDPNDMKFCRNNGLKV
ncbi:hypothetical protein BC940DRAFT_310377 [Gongronella butleri]|nr:hypothetical protein BC940DRAFT_310377 [Gongronella butleri]